MSRAKMKIEREIRGRHCVHYETLPHFNCPDSERCDCDCDACVVARGGKVLSQINREWFIKHYQQQKKTTTQE